MARRTFAQYKAEVLHALGNPATALLDVSPGDIVNDALEHLATLHEWQWCSTNQQELGIVAQQKYVTLPEDFGAVIAVEHDQGWASHFTPVSWEILLWMRQHPITEWTGGYFYTVNTGNVTVDSAGLSAPTMELFPTPSETDPDAVQLVYRRFLRPLVADTDVPMIPRYMDRPLSLLARSMASTDYDDDPQSAYTAEFRTLIADAMYKDGMSLGSVGVPTGALNPRRRPVPWGYPINGIPNPIQA